MYNSNSKFSLTTLASIFVDIDAIVDEACGNKCSCCSDKSCDKNDRNDVQIEVECKQCKRKVFNTDKECWFCEIANPGEKD